MKRDWMSVGADYVETLGKRSVEHEIEAMEWQDIPVEGSLDVAFCPGYAIKAVIAELGLPKVSAISISSFDRPSADPDGDGFYPGFYGIEANYKDGRARVYVLDVGTTITPLVADFFPTEGVAA